MYVDMIIWHTTITCGVYITQSNNRVRVLLVFWNRESSYAFFFYYCTFDYAMDVVSTCTWIFIQSVSYSFPPICDDGKPRQYLSSDLGVIG